MTRQKHYDYVMCPDGRKRKLYSRGDIDALQAEWQEYCENNWLSFQGGHKKDLFDPESKVKFMLDGIGNILLRNHMDGIMTEYKKMKIGNYEIPLSSCMSLLSDTVYSERPMVDNGEAKMRMDIMFDRLGEKYEEAKAAKESVEYREKKARAVKKIFPPTRLQKIEKAKKTYSVVRIVFARVDTDNRFLFDGNYYTIPASCKAYAPKATVGGEEVYDMDTVMCAETVDGGIVFFDMEIKEIEGVLKDGDEHN